MKVSSFVDLSSLSNYFTPDEISFIKQMSFGDEALNKQVVEKIVKLLINIENSHSGPESFLTEIQEIKNLIGQNLNNDTTIFAKKSKSDEHISFNILNNISNNIRSDSGDELPSSNVLRVSEKENKVFLPFTKNEIRKYMDQYPQSYLSPESVIKKEFVLPLDYYMRHPVVARFREAYSLIKDREGKSVFEALSYAFNLMFKYELNPVIIAACKNQAQLEAYLDALASKNLDNFNYFEIKFEVSLAK